MRNLIQMICNLKLCSHLAVLWLAGMCVACGGDLPSPTTITSTRVLGAQVSVVGDTSRATPSAGETVDVSWVIASPTSSSPKLYHGFVACVPAPNRTGIAFCEQAPFAFENSSVSTRDHRFQFIVPADIGSAKELLIIGAWCAGGRPLINPEQYTNVANLGASVVCDNAPSEDPVVAIVKTTLVSSDQRNRNPSWDEAVIRFQNDQIWEPFQSGEDTINCGDPPRSDLPRFEANGSFVALSLFITDATRERYAEGGEQKIETLTLSSFTNRGSLDKTFRVIESKDSQTGIVLTNGWKRPTEIVSGQEWVQMFFVLRDNRGGLAVTKRYACLVP